MKLQVVFILLFINYTNAVNHYPILIWHSAGEAFSSSEIVELAKLIKSKLGENVYVKSVRIGNNTEQDKSLSLFTHPFTQIKQVCDEIKADVKFQKGYNAIGLSQGGLFMRGLLQECDGPEMKNLISLGGPQQGVYDYPKCQKVFGPLCFGVQLLIGVLVYSADTQEGVAPASYWHDPEREIQYRNNSTFLAIINNENTLNQNYIERIKKLRNLVLVKYVDDISIIPNESSHFGYERESKVIKLKDMDIYKEDRLGLRALDEKGGLIFLECPGGHLKLNQKWFTENVIKYLNEIKVD